MRAAAPRADGESSEALLCGLREDDEFVWGKVRVACAEQTRKGASAMQGRDLDVKLLRAPLTMVRAPFGRPAYKYSTAARTAHNTSAALGGSAPSQGGRQPRALQGTERRRGAAFAASCRSNTEVALRTAAPGRHSAGTYGGLIRRANSHGGLRARTESI